MNRLCQLFGLVALVVGFAGSCLADSAAIITKARAYLGGDAALNAVRSIHYVGTLSTTDQVDGVDKLITTEIDIIFQKPYQQRIVITKEKLIETTALDDYEAWHQQLDKSDPSRWRTELFQKMRVKQFRAGSWENLAFFVGLEQLGGSVVDYGQVELAGKPAYKIGFVHEPGIVYLRYFDPQTGRLLLTETDQGVKIREEGEILAGGVKFPSRIINTNTAAPGGKERVVTIDISKVTVNETFPDEIFHVPLLPPK